jgi:hypothetical protein
VSYSILVLNVIRCTRLCQVVGIDRIGHRIVLHLF